MHYGDSRSGGKGESKAAALALFDTFREDDASIDDGVYLGGYEAKESGYFLCVTRHLRAGAEPIEVVWIFQIDRYTRIGGSRVVRLQDTPGGCLGAATRQGAVLP